jgi:hypothetical protein
MRARYLFAITVVLVAGVAAKWLFFSTTPAEAQLESPTLNILQMQTDYPNMKDMPVQEVTDPV